MISVKTVLLLHAYSIRDFGGGDGVRDSGLLQSAAERPFSTFSGKELYPTPFSKAAAIFESIVKNHPFIDGNKRTGWLACIITLRLPGYKFTLSEEDAYEFVIKVASSHMDFDDIVSFIEKNTKRIN